MTINQDTILEITKDAGHEIMKIYSNLALAADIDYKEDKSPLTLADRASHVVINEGLKKVYPSIPVLSEEGGGIPYQTRKDFEYYWLVDPLDGTKEFINRNGEFTVNIALIHKRKPIAGFIFAPVLNTFYVGVQEEAYKIHGTEKIALHVNNRQKDRIAVRSKSHASQEEESVLNKYDVTDSISVGSSLKFCMVAEGKADVYYRFGPTMEWDTAAGQAIVEAAGGKVMKETGPEPFLYNKENLLNTGFLCLGF
jgi:3'(2'), 5'-bisphosphate nucleotidase